MNEQALEITEKPVLPLAITTNPAQTAPAKQDAAQARIEHVADLLNTAYQKASTLVLTPEEIAKLSAPFDDSDVCTGAGGDPNLLYLQHSSIRRRLASVFSPGQWALINRRTWLDEQQGFMYADCVLLIRGCYVGEAIGAQRWTPKNPRMNYSDSVEGAQSEALRRIAGKYLDCGVQLWDKHYCEAWKARQKEPRHIIQTQKQNAPNPIVARSEPSPSPSLATESHRKRLIELLTPLGAAALEYCQKSGMLLPTEELDDLPLRFVPATKEQKDDFMVCVQSFVDGGEAKKPAYVIEGDEIPMNFSPKQADPLAESLNRIEEQVAPAGNRIVGKVQAISQKSGTNKKTGKPWTKYGIKIADGYLDTFDSKIAEICEQAKSDDKMVDIEYQDKPWGVGKTSREILSCVVVEPQTDLIP